MEAGLALYLGDASLADVRRELAPGASWYVLDVGPDQSKRAFFAAVRRSLPQDPPLGDISDSWDAFSDSVHGGLIADHQGGGDAVIYWRDAHRMKSEGDAEVYRIAIECFEYMSDDVNDPMKTDHPISLLILLAGHADPLWPPGPIPS